MSLRSEKRVYVYSKIELSVIHALVQTRKELVRLVVED